MRYSKHFLIPQTLRVDFKHIICVKTLLQRGILRPVLYDYLVHKFKGIEGKANFNDQLLRKVIKRYKNVRYHMKVCMSGCKPNHGL